MKKALRTVLWWEILTGVCMLIDVVTKLFSGRGASLATPGGIAFIAFGTLGLVAGVGLWRRSAYAWPASVALQVLLLPVFWLGQFEFRPGVGVFLPLGIKFAPDGSIAGTFELTLGVDFSATLHATQAHQYAAINLAALACLIVLLLQRRQ